MSIFNKYFRICFTVYAIVIFLLLMMIVLLPVVVIALLIKHPEKAIHKAMRCWAKSWFFFIGIQFKALNKQNYQEGQTYIFIANHISYLDIPTIILSVDTPVKILGKAELTKVPIFGWIYKIAVIPVDRTDAKSKANSLEVLKKKLKKGVSVIVFPEGGFNETNEPLKMFYSGAFKLSKELKVPIAPILILNTKERLHYSNLFSFNPGISTIKYLPLIYPENYLSAEEMKEDSFNIMLRGLVDNLQ